MFKLNDMILALETEDYLSVRGYQYLDRIGEGGFASVSLLKRENQFYALKAIKKQTDDAIIKLIQTEIQLLRDFRDKHPFICSSIEDFETRSYVCIIMKYYNSDLLKLTQEKAYNLSEVEAKHIIKQIYNALYFLHGRQIIHRDLKAQNIFIDCQQQLWNLFKEGSISRKELILQSTFILGDFGISRTIEKDASTFCGSQSTMAPEVFLRKRYDFKADIYSLGAIFFKLMHGSIQFGVNNFRETISVPTKEIISQMLSFNPDERPSYTKLDQYFDIVRFKMPAPVSSNTSNISQTKQKIKIFNEQAILPNEDFKSLKDSFKVIHRQPTIQSPQFSPNKQEQQQIFTPSCLETLEDTQIDNQENESFSKTNFKEPYQFGSQLFQQMQNEKTISKPIQMMGEPKTNLTSDDSLSTKWSS